MKSTIRTFAVAMAIFGWGIIPVSAAAIDNVIDHIAEALAVDNLCGRLKANGTLMALASQYWGMTVADIRPGGRYHQRLIDLTRQKQLKMVGYGEEIVCMSGDLLYGPNGINVKNLLVPE